MERGDIIMKVLCTSDLHGRLPMDLPLDGIDAVVIAGDVCPDVAQYRNTNAAIQIQWLGSHFANWVNTSVRRPVILTWGNHDAVGEFASREDLAKELAEAQYPVHVLVDEPLTLTDFSADERPVTFYGTPWSVRFGWWSFMAEDDELDALYAEIPTNLDMLISHGPPHAHGDRTVDGRFVGSHSLVSHIKRTTPRHVVCGHIHEGRGAYRLNGHTSVWNVSYVDERYRPYPADTKQYRIITL